jgi:flavin reductase (DIM6/NTAB) family NADH-FMN oxidoreductase RutF
MLLDPDTLNTRDMYRWLIHCLVPRPIAWVSTISPDGVTNLAPFSFFQGVCARPPTLMFCPVNDRHGRPKDTLRNVEATGEFVVNLVPFALAETMNATAATLPYGESEFARFHVAAEPSVKVKPPRVAGVPVAFECRLDRVVRLSEGPAGGNAVFGRILALHCADAALGPAGLPEPARLDLIARLGGDGYLRVGEHFTLPRAE